MRDIQGNMPDGHVAQDGLRFRERSINPGEMSAYIPFPVIGIVTEVYAVGDSANRDDETILLDITVSDMGLKLYKVPWLGRKGSIDNYVHDGSPVAPKKNVVDDVTKTREQWNDLRINPKIAENDSVFVQFAFGKVHQPYAVAIVPHNQTENLSPSPRPRRVDGDIHKVRFNGTNMFIDKDGNVLFESTKTYDESITRNKKFTVSWKDPDKTQAVKVEIDNTLNAPKTEITVTKEDGKFQKVKMDGQANEIMATNQHDSGVNSIRMHPGGLDVAVKGNLTETIDGNTTRSVTGTRSESITGNQTDNYSADYTINVSGNCNLTAGGNVVVQGSQITLNGSAGQVLTTVTDPVIDLITGAPTTGVPTVLAG